MPIRVKCSCGKVLNVKDELAGKKGKCPGCGNAIPIPQPKPAAAPARKKHYEDDDDDEDGSPYDLNAKDKGPTPEEIEEEERKRKKRIAREEAAKEEREQTDKMIHFIVVGIGLLMLVGLGVAPMLNWFSLKNKGISTYDLTTLYSQKTTLLGGEWDKEAKIFLGLSFFCALLAGVGLGLYAALGEDAGEHALTINCCICETWSITALLWSAGFFWWWIYIKRYQFEEKTKTNLTVEISAVPDIGWILAIVAALLAAILFSYSLTKRHDKGWCYLSQFLGLVFGGLAVWLDVKPW